MTSLAATEVARKFFQVISRVGAGEEVEVVRNGVPVVLMRPAQGRQVISAARWRELMDRAPAVDDDFARDIEASRETIGPAGVAWPS